jgi:hypothetical protein
MMAFWKPKHVAKYCLELQTYFTNCCVVTVFNKEIYIINTTGCIHWKLGTVCWKKPSWPNFRYHCNICLERLRKITEKVSRYLVDNSCMLTYLSYFPGEQKNTRFLLLYNHSCLTNVTSVVIRLSEKLWCLRTEFHITSAVDTRTRNNPLAVCPSFRLRHDRTATCSRPLNLWSPSNPQLASISCVNEIWLSSLA